MSPKIKLKDKKKSKKAGVPSPQPSPLRERARPTGGRAAGGGRGHSLVIVESPTKQKTIAKFLGRGYTIMATLGHIRDLPSRQLGIDETNGFEPQYVVLPKAKKVVPGLKEAVKTADQVYLATDFDREGEAIAWHVAEVLNVDPERLFRITFHEITPSAIQASLEHPRQIDLALVQSQQARRILDRIVGYKLSPLLWAKVRKGLSAGRVQSVALRLLVERDREISAFKSQAYWTIEAELQKGKDPAFRANLVEIDGKKIEQTSVSKLFADDYRVTTTSLMDAKLVESLAERLKKAAYRVEKVVQKEATRSPAPPFMTATLQQDASRRLGFSAVKTMVIAQQLYEGVELGDAGSVGLITYMRTDSLNIAATAQQEARQFVKSRYGQDYLPERPRTYKSKSKGAQEAHEAIRPTAMSRTPESVKTFLSADQAKLYDLIWRRFMASQMADAIFDTVGVDIRAKTPSPLVGEGKDGGSPPPRSYPTRGEEVFLFHASGRTVKAQGFLKVYEQPDEREFERKDDAQKLPLLKEAEALSLLQVLSEAHASEPPPRFNEASLIKMLERHGIGRPSTYAPILQTIIGRGYVREEGRRLFPSDLGAHVTDLLIGHFPGIVDLQFTARVEERLDEIAQGESAWADVIKEFYGPFIRALEKARTNITTKPYEPKESGEMCSKCGAPMLIRESRFGRYMSCKAYPACKNKISLDASGKKIVPEVVDKKCDQCGKPLVKRFGRRGPFLACSGYPDCKTTYSVDKEGNLFMRPPPQMTDKKCEKCGKPMLLRVGKRGPFLTCSGFPRCRNLKKAPADVIPAKA